MAIQSRSTSRARPDAVIGALIVATIAIAIAGTYTVLAPAGVGTSPALVGGALDPAAAEAALIEVRAAERSLGWTIAPERVSRVSRDALVATPTAVERAAIARAAGWNQAATPTSVERASIVGRAVPTVAVTQAPERRGGR